MTTTPEAAKLVERLRAELPRYAYPLRSLHDEAADLIDRLTAPIAVGERILGRVSNCRECPHRNYLSAGRYECFKTYNGVHPNTARFLPDGHTKEAPIPDWCPLEAAAPPLPPADPSARARELLAEEYDRAGCYGWAERLRKAQDSEVEGGDACALRAIERALSLTPSAVGDVEATELYAARGRLQLLRVNHADRNVRWNAGELADCDDDILSAIIAALSPTPNDGGDVDKVDRFLIDLAECPDLEEMAADGGITVGMVFQQQARWMRTLLARAALAAAQGEGWQDISTAPRDGTDVLLLHTAHGPIAGRFSPGEWSDDTPISPREYSGAVWVLGDDVEQVEVEELPDGYFDGAIAHWRPLPLPPRAEGGGE